MELIDINNLEQLDEILGSLKSITNLLSEALDRNVQIKSKVYKELAKSKISSKLSMESKLIELVSDGNESLVDEFLLSEHEVSKLKYHQRYAVEALNTKKHMNNVIVAST